jgi:hypothetical protein
MTTAPLGNAEQIVARINDLQAQLQQNLPGYESLLHLIHRQLAADPDMAHILSEDQIGVIFAGLTKKKQIVIATEKAKSKRKPAGSMQVGTDL